MSVNKPPVLEKWTRIFSLSGVLIALAFIALLATIHSVKAVQIFAALATALATAGLNRLPICLDPSGELSLAPVVTIATMVLFGWPAAVVGAAVGIAIGFLDRPPREVLNRATDELPALVSAAVAAAVVQIPGGNKEIDAVIIAMVGYTVVRTLTVSIRMHIEEAIAWRQSLRFLVRGTFFHLGVFTGVASTTLWMVSSTTVTIDRLLAPVAAAAVTLQLYLPRILRGQEQRRVLTAVSVLAAAVDAKDAYTANHSLSVARLCQRVARLLDLNEVDVHSVYLAALLHDVGKTVVPAEILKKPGPLTAEEYETVRTHVDAGVRIVQTIRGLQGVAPIVGASHEHMDGIGYPSGLKGEKIPLGARIILAVDAYDALTTDRPYRASQSPEAAVRELEAHAGSQFDPQVITALRTAIGLPRPKAPMRLPAWVALLRQRTFGLLLAGELVSFIGDNVFFVAVTLWVWKLTSSATMLALALIAATVGQGLLGFLAGALADRLDRRSVIIASDITRAALVSLLAFVLPRDLAWGFTVILLLNIGVVFFRTGIFALIPSVVPRNDLLTANALYQTTQRIGEILGSALGGAIVVTMGFNVALYLDAASFFVSAACVAMMPVTWRAGLGTAPPRKISVEVGEGLRYIWQTPIHRVLALLIFPGYVTLAFDVLQAPMVVKTAGLQAIAYGIINSAVAVGKLLSATVLAGGRKQWVNVPFTVLMFLVTSLATILFGSTTAYTVLIAAAFMFGLGNVATNIANATLSMMNAPSEIIGRLMASRGVFVSSITIFGMLLFGRLADDPVLGPPIALGVLGATSALGVLLVWFTAGRQLRNGGNE